MRPKYLERINYDKPNDGGTVTPPVVVPVVPPVEPPKEPVVAAPVIPPIVPPPEVPKKDWKDDRIAKLTHNLNEERRQRAATPVVPTIQNPGETEAQFQSRVDAAATEKAGMMAAQADWDRQCNAVADAGKAEFPDFTVRLKGITDTINGQDQAEVQAYNEVLAAAIETGQAHKIIYSLGSDPGEYQRLMKLSPVKRAMELGKMAVGLVNERPPSSLPNPIVPIGSRGEHYEGITPDDPKNGMKLSKADWFKRRDVQARAKGIQ